MLLVFLIAAAPVSLEMELAGGIALPIADVTQDAPPPAPALQARAGADFFDHVTVSAVLLGIAGPETSQSFCAGGGGACKGNASFRAVSGFVAVRLHLSSDAQPFLEAGIGPGKLISVSADDLFENPAQHGSAGPAYLIGLGGRVFVSRQLALGLELAWTQWTNVSRPAFVYGSLSMPARSDLTVSSLLLLFAVSWSAGR